MLFLKAREAVKENKITPTKASSGLMCGHHEPTLCLQQTKSSHLTHGKLIQLLTVTFHSYFERTRAWYV